ncbi:MAG: SDH family Clp fold serine proteinase [Thermoplasmatota archaeon]
MSYLRAKFNDIRVIIPHAAMSATTMLACASNKIVMGKHSFLGPKDPQLILQTQLGRQAVPAQAILGEFEMDKRECQDPNKLGSWLPILGQCGPALLVRKSVQDLLKKFPRLFWVVNTMELFERAAWRRPLGAVTGPARPPQR